MGPCRPVRGSTGFLRPADSSGEFHERPGGSMEPRGRRAFGMAPGVYLFVAVTCVYFASMSREVPWGDARPNLRRGRVHGAWRRHRGAQPLALGCAAGPRGPILCTPALAAVRCCTCRARPYATFFGTCTPAQRWRTCWRFLACHVAGTLLGGLVAWLFLPPVPAPRCLATRGWLRGDLARCGQHRLGLMRAILSARSLRSPASPAFLPRTLAALATSRPTHGPGHGFVGRPAAQHQVHLRPRISRRLCCWSCWCIERNLRSLGQALGSAGPGVSCQDCSWSCSTNFPSLRLRSPTRATPSWAM